MVRLISFTLFQLLFCSILTAQTESQGYYFTLTHQWELGKSGIWLSNYYTGFIEEETFNSLAKIRLKKHFYVSSDTICQLVAERNPNTVEENHIELMLFGKPTFLDDLRDKKTEGKLIFSEKRRSKILLEIIYGTFIFRQNQTTIEEYENGYMGTSHKRISVFGADSEVIEVLDLMEFRDLRVLNEAELNKIKVR